MRNFTLKPLTTLGILTSVCLLLGFSQSLSAQDQADFVIDPPTAAVNISDTFSVTVKVQTTDAVSGAESHLTFNPAVLQVTGLMPTGPLSIPVITPVFDNGLGTIDYAGGTLGTPPTANFDFLTIQFSAIATGTSDLEFVDPLGVPATKITNATGNILVNATGATITVGSSDTTPPVITLNGPNPLELTVGDTYVEPGATASDDTDGDISGSIIIDNSTVNTGEEGTYFVSYNVDDAAGNSALEVLRTVNVNPIVIPTYNITVNAGPNGSISPTSATVNAGGSQIFNITPNPGYETTEILVNGNPVAIAPTYEFTNVQANATIAATFGPLPPFQVCIASGNTALTAFGRNFLADPNNTPPPTTAFSRTNGKAYKDYSGPIAGTTPGSDEELLFQKEIYGGAGGNNPEFSYDIPVADGFYQVDLYFAEVFHGNAGGRIFDVFLQGNLLLDEYDLVDPIKDGVGLQTAITRTYYVQVTGGTLSVQIGPAFIDNGKLSGLCVTEVSSANLHPVATIGDLNFDALTPVAEALNINDPENDQLTITFNNMPASLTYNPSNNQLEGTPTVAEVGTYTINAIITDGTSSPVTEEFVLTINPAAGDDPPTIDPIADIRANEGEAISVPILVTDDNDPSATIEIFDISEGGTNPFNPTTTVAVGTFMDNTGGSYTFSWTPSSGQGRSYLARVTANDGVNPAVVEEFKIDVAQQIQGLILARTFNNPLPWYGSSNPGNGFTVAIETTPAKNIGYIGPGEFVEYWVNVQTAGTYDLRIKAAKGNSGTTIISLSEDNGGFSTIGTVAVPQSTDPDGPGGISPWQVYSDFNTSVVFTNPGLQVIRLDFNGGVNVEEFEFTQVTVNEPPVVTIGGPPAKTVPEQEILQVPISVGDIDGDNLTVTISTQSNEPQLLQTANSGTQVDPFPIDASGFMLVNDEDNTPGSYTANLDFTPIFGDGGGADGDGSAVYTITIEVTDGTVTVTETFDVTVTDVHQGIAAAGVTRIEAESFDDQGPPNTTPGGTGGTLGIGVEVNDPGVTNIGFTHQGDYAEYLIDVAQAGTYTFTFAVAKDSGPDGTLTINGGPGSITVTPTGGWQSYTNAVTQVDLPAGQQILRFDWSGNNGFLFNVDYFDVEPVPNEAPVFANFVSPSDGEVTRDCEGDGEDFILNANFTDTEDDANAIPLTIEWFDGNTSLGIGNPLNTSLAVGSHTLSAVATDSDLNSTPSSETIDVEVVAAPIFTITQDAVGAGGSVLEGATLDGPTDVTVCWDVANLEIGGAFGEHIHIRLDDGDNGQGSGGSVGGRPYVRVDAASGCFTFTNVSVGPHKISFVGAETGHNQICDETEVNFDVVDTTAPTLVETDPTEGAIDVATDAVLTATFSEPVQWQTGAPVSIFVNDLTTSDSFDSFGPGDAEVVFNGNSLSIDPTADFVPGHEYVVLISGGALEDTSSNPFAGLTTVTWTFTIIDQVPPTLVSTDPSDNDNDVAVDAVLTATFSEPVQWQAAPADIVIFDLTNGTPFGTLNEASSALTFNSNDMIIDPMADFLPNTEYEVQIGGSSLEDAAGNAFAGIANGDWSFTTAPAPCFLAITEQPQDATLCEEDTSLQFSVVATGSGTLSYNWQAFGNGLTEWTDVGIQNGNATVILNSPIQLAANGIQYRVIITDDQGTPGDTNDDCALISDVATLTVNPLPTVAFSAPADLNISAGVQANLAGGTPIQGTETGDSGTYSGPGVTDNGNGTYDFDPEEAGAGTHTIVYTYTNANGCTNTASDDIVVTADTTAPTITCPTAITVGNEAGLCSASFPIIPATATDDVSLVENITISSERSDSNLLTLTDPFPVGETTITWTATDEAGNSTSCDQTITVNDTEAPSAICQDITIQLDAAGNASIAAGDVDGGSTDNCGVAGLSVSPSTFDSSNIGANIVTLTVTDTAGLTSSCTATVTVQDVTPPTAVCQDIDVFLDENGLASIAADDIDNGSNDTSGGVSLSLDRTTFDCTDLGTPVTVTLTVTDDNANSATCTATVTVLDNTGPVVSCNANITDTSLSGLPLTIEIVPPTAADNCDNASTVSGLATLPDTSTFVLSDQTDLYNFPVGTTNIVWTGTDAQSNTGICNQTVTVNFTPSSASNIISFTAAGVAGTINGTDITVEVPFGTNLQALAPEITVSEFATVDPEDGEAVDFTGGTVVYTVTAQDNSTTAYSVLVSIAPDTTDPTITCPADIVVDNDTGECGALVTFEAIFNDDRPGSTVTYSPDSGSFFTVGTTQVTATVTDAAGNTASCNFDVTVNDSEVPVVTCPANIVETLAFGATEGTVTYALPVFGDNCPGGTMVQTGGLASGESFPLGTTTNTFMVTDASGNTASCSFNVTVEEGADMEDPIVTCPADIVVDNDAGQCAAAVTFIATATDNGGTANISYSQDPGTLFPVGTTTVVVTATDAAGNTANCSFDVTVNDTELPVIICPTDITQVSSSSVVIEDIGTATATDNCPGLSVPTASLSSTEFIPVTDTFPVGITTVYWTAIDTSGNAVQCVQQIFINMPANLDPVADAGPDQVLVDGDNSGDEQVSLDGTGSNDNDGNIVSYVWKNGATQVATGASPTVTLPVGTTTLTLTVTDDDNASSSDDVVITIDEDTTNPTITCPSDITVNNDPGQCGAIVNYTAPVGTDENPGAVTEQTGGLVSGSFFPVGTTIEEYTVTDASGNTASCNFTITVLDAQAPTIDCPSDITVSAGQDNTPAVVNFTAPTFTDNCPGANVQQIAGLPSGSAFPIGTTTNTFEVTDASGSTASCSFDVIVEPVIPQTLSITGFILVNADTDTDIGPLTNNLSLNFAPLQGVKLSIRAEATADVESVKLELTGTKLATRTENFAPYALYGDSAGNYGGQQFSLGGYTIKATPYSANGLGGNQGTSLIANFTLTDQDPQCIGFGAAITAVSNPTSCGGVGSATAVPSGGEAPYTYLWDNGNTNATATNLVAGTRSVTVTDGNGCTVVKTVVLTNPAPPVVTIGNVPTLLTTDAPYTLVVSPTGGTFSGTGVNGSGVFDPSIGVGTYAITYTYTDPNTGCSASATRNITVTTPTSNAALIVLDATTDTPLFALTNGLQINKNAIGNTPLGIIFNPDLNPNGVFFSLTGPIKETRAEGTFPPYSLFGDIGVNVQGKPFPVGNYILTANPNNGPTVTVNFSVISGPPPNQPPSAVASGTPDASIAFKVNFSSQGSTDNDGNIVGYSWNFGDGNTSNTQNPSHTYVTGGTKTVTLTVTDDDGDSGSTTFQVVAIDPFANQDPSANAGVDQSVVDSDGSGDENIALNGSASSDDDGTIVSYEWTNGGNPIATGATPTVLLPVGTTVLTLTVTDDDGATDTDTVSITISEQPDVDRVDSFVLVNAANNQDLFEIANNASIVANSPNGRSQINIRANTNPTVVGSVKFALSGTVTRNWTESAAPYALYGDFLGNYNEAVLPIGSYTLTATPYSSAGGNGIAGQALTITFAVVSQSNAAKLPVNSMQISPNPADTQVTMRFDEPAQITDVFVYDITGRLVQKIRPNKGQNEDYLLRVYDLPPGTYFVRTRDANGKEFQQQMVIKR